MPSGNESGSRKRGAARARDRQRRRRLAAGRREWVMWTRSCAHASLRTLASISGRSCQTYQRGGGGGLGWGGGKAGLGGGAGGISQVVPSKTAPHAHSTFLPSFPFPTSTCPQRYPDADQKGHSRHSPLGRPGIFRAFPSKGFSRSGACLLSDAGGRSGECVPLLALLLDCEHHQGPHRVRP